MPARQGCEKGVVVGHTEDAGQLYASYDDAAHHVAGAVRSSRFAAALAPFRNRDAALRALAHLGAVVDG